MAIGHEYLSFIPP